MTKPLSGEGPSETAAPSSALAVDAGSAFRLSLVIEYPNTEAAPPIGRQECLGGTIVALQFSDALSEIEHLRETLSHLQHYTSCTSLQFELIEEALKWPNGRDEGRAGND